MNKRGKLKIFLISLLVLLLIFAVFAAVYHEYVYLPDSDHSLIQNPIGHLKYFVKLFEYCKKYF